MRRMALVLLVLGLGPVAVQANPPCGPCNPFPWKVDTGIRFNFQLVPNGGAQLGPWYNYWPLEAHFQTPAPPAYPFWPQGQPGPEGLPPATPAAPATPGTPPMGGPNTMGPANFHGGHIVPVGYQRYSVPYYWQR